MSSIHYPKFSSTRLSDYSPAECCGKCGHHKPYDAGTFTEWTCDCEASPYYQDFTDYRDFCGEFAERGSEYHGNDFSD